MWTILTYSTLSITWKATLKYSDEHFRMNIILDPQPASPK